MLTVNLAPEVENQVRRNAAERGQDADQYLGQLIQVALRQPVPPVIPAKSSLEEFVRHIHERGQRRDMTYPPIPEEALRRESMYDDEGR